MSILAALLGYGLVKGACTELRIADQKYMDRKLKEVEEKHMGGKYRGYMNPYEPRWDAYCDEVNPLRIKFGREPLKKNSDKPKEEQERIRKYQEWKRAQR